MQNLILTVGYPRSGKSTWSMSQGHPVVNPDSIRLAVHGKPFLAKLEGVVWNTAFKMAKALLLAGHETVIVDATNIDVVSRKSWINKFKDYNVTFVEFDADAETCIQRAKDTEKDYLIPVIEEMKSKREPVGKDEGVCIFV